MFKGGIIETALIIWLIGWLFACGALLVDPILQKADTSTAVKWLIMLLLGVGWPVYLGMDK